MKKLFSVVMILYLFVFTGTSFAQSANANAEAGASANASPTINFNYPESDPALGAAALKEADNPNAYRSFPVGTPITFGNLISHFGPRSNSGGYQSLQELLLYVNIFTEDALKNIAKGKGDFAVANDFKSFPKPGKYRDTRWIMMVIQERKVVKDSSGKETVMLVRFPNAAFKGYASAYATHEGQKMYHVMAKAALEALQAGCNVIEFTMEGASIDTVASGWGIGINNSLAYVPAGQNQQIGNVAAGGLGYSKAQAGMRDLPWVNGNGLVVPDSVIESALAHVPLNVWDVEPEQTGNHKKK